MIIKKFKAAILKKKKNNLIFRDIYFKDELKRGQVFVKLKYSGICGKQIDEIDGIGGKDPYLPHLLGHEGSGIVLKIGPGVKKVKKNDNVILHWIKSNGIQSETPKYFLKNKIINAGWVTTFNEYAIVSENRVTKIAKGYSLKKACLFGCVATTGLGLATNELNLKYKDILLVVGVGGLGQVIVQSAKNYKIKKIIAIDVNNLALKKAKKFGADIVLNIKNEKNLKNLKKLNINKAVVTTGNIKAIEKTIKILSLPSICYIMGVPKKQGFMKVNAWNIMHDQTIKGSLGGNTFPEKDIPKFINLEKAGKINLNKIIYKTINFNEINKGIKMFKSLKTTGRILVKF
jgi:Zn-dependent alcohol dehydrogenase